MDKMSIFQTAITEISHILWLLSDLLKNFTFYDRSLIFWRSFSFCSCSKFLLLKLCFQLFFWSTMMVSMWLDLCWKYTFDGNHAFIKSLLKINKISLVFMTLSWGKSLGKVECFEATCDLLIIIWLFMMERIFHVSQPSCHFLIFFVEKVFSCGFVQVLNECHVFRIHEFICSFLIYLFSEG